MPQPFRNLVAWSITAASSCLVVLALVFGSAGVAEAGVIPPPEILSGPKVTNTQEGTLKCTSVWERQKELKFAFEWFRDGALVAGKTAEPFYLEKNDEGHEFSCRATATNSSGTVTTGISEPVVATRIPYQFVSASIKGVPRIGNTLVCSPGEWRGFPAPAFTYEWFDNQSTVAKTQTVTVTAAEEEGSLWCRVTGTNSVGSKTVETWVEIENAPVNRKAPSIVPAAPRIKGNLICDPGTWGGVPTPTFAYRWLRDGVLIEGAEATHYRPSRYDVGHRVGCQVTATNAVGSVTLTTETYLIEGEPVPPTNVVAPTISGSPVGYKTLQCAPGEWTGSPQPTFSYEWQRDGIGIATGSSYTTRDLDVGHRLRCVVTAHNVGGEASSASAAVTIAVVAGCPGGPIAAQGSMLQAAAQLELWSAPYNVACAPRGEVDYTPTSSSAALASWGFYGGPFEPTDALIATDEPPTASQIAAANAATNSNILVVPVAQTAIGVVVNPPTGCSIEEITNKQLESVIRGNIKIWNKLQTAAGAGCVNAPIVRVLPGKASGATHQFKHYMGQINSAALACTEGAKTWKQLEQIGADEATNAVWPESGVGGCGAGQVSPLVAAAPGIAEVKAINVTEGSFGYAALPDIEAAKANGENPHDDTNWLKLQNNGVSNKLAIAWTAAPVEEIGDSAECGASRYALPPAVRRYESWNQESPVNADWSTISGSDPNIAAATGTPTSYPLCMLTYVVMLQSYANAGFSTSVADTATDYVFNQALGETGQEALEVGGRFYASLPTDPGNAIYDVLGAAKGVANRLN